MRRSINKSTFWVAILVASLNTQQILASHSPDLMPTYTQEIDPTRSAIQSSSTVTIPTPTTSDPTLENEIKNLANRLTDLFLCVPGRWDTQFSTQSWYLMNTFNAYNTALAKSTYPKDKVFDDSLKKVFIDTALARLAARNPDIAKDESIMKYIESLADASQGVFKKSLESRATFRKSSAIASVLEKIQTNGKSVFSYLKDSQSKHAAALSRLSCTNVKATFWVTPKFGFPSTEQSAAEATTSTPDAAPMTPGSGPHGGVSELKPEVPVSSPEFDKTYYRSKRINTQLPYSSWEDRKTKGYHTYYGNNGYLWGRPYVIGNILKAASVLKEKGIYMGVGDINRKPSWTNPYHQETPGHGSHDQGRAVDLRLIGPDGEARRCTVEQPECYDRGKTFQMIKALIDADPKELRVIYINDPKLRAMIEEYLRNAHGFSRAAADDAVQYWPCHDNHVHFHWKSDYNK